MCGIAGYCSRSLIGTPERLVAMVRSIRHRGPDDEGFSLIHSVAGDRVNLAGSESDPLVRDQFIRGDQGGPQFPHTIGLGQRRFSIVDLSPGGHQPMWDASGGACIVFNGEVYNYLELRAELERLGRTFMTSSDTEVLLQGYMEWGTEVFSRLNGPFAVAIYDQKERKLLLARDRIGKSPLYYATWGNTFFFSSEIKSILAVCDPNAFSVRHQAVDDFILLGLRDLDGTFWRGIEDFPPACYGWLEEDLALTITRYWSLPNHRLTCQEIGPVEAGLELRRLLTDAINIRLRADVAVGFELSGGMDSSSIVALTAADLGRDLPTFTVKFEQEDVDESAYAQAVIDKYADSIRAHIYVPEREDFWRNAEQFVRIQEEPFHSPNLHTNQILRRMIRQKGFKVVITGSAGDEILAGYPNIYFPLFVRHLLAQGDISSCFWEIWSSTEFSVQRLVELLSKYSFQGILRRVLRNRAANEIDPTRAVYRKGSDCIPRRRSAPSFSARLIENMTQRRMNYWLRSGNKANFGIPIEPRCPFLDYRVVEFAFSLPPQYLIHNGWHKWVLRDALRDILPEMVLWRKNKMGFPFPHMQWLGYSRNIILRTLEGCDCPYIDHKRLVAEYERLRMESPVLLWRIISVGLWWRMVINAKPFQLAA